MIRQFELVERVQSYDPDADEAMLNRAYVYTVQKHGSQKRASGDPYFSHPVEVAGLMTELKLDQETIVTALLHDTVEDTLATIEDIDKLFGPEVARLVDGVTKLSKIEAMGENERAAENLRKFFLAMSEDIRVLLVKLADRLHNMRTLDAVSPAQRRRVARETMEIMRATLGLQSSGFLVDARLAACVNIIPGMTSIYRWEGKIARDSEAVMVIKTRRSLAEAAIAAARQRGRRREREGEDDHQARGEREVHPGAARKRQEQAGEDGQERHMAPQPMPLLARHDGLNQKKRGQDDVG